MSPPRYIGDQDRVFVRKGRRHYRLTYSSTEFRIGIAVVGLLVVIVAWVAWRGAHPDPELFASQADLLLTGEPRVDRGPMPTGLTGPGWTEGPISRFDSDNLYEKINGREGYYKGFGFQQLFFVSLGLESDPTVAVDIELFDLAEPANALGAYAGERPEEVPSTVAPGGMRHLHRNALLMTRGSFYIRALGSDESPAVRTQLEHLLAAFEESLPGEGLPAPYAVFVGGMALDPSRVSYVAENAFSFEFGRNVYTALLEDDETEVFLVSTERPEQANGLANDFNKGFQGYGKPLAGSGTIPWTEDRYIGTLAGAVSHGSWVIGVRGAPDVAAAEAALASLREAMVAVP